MLTRNTDSWRARYGSFMRLDINTRPRMANRNVSWVPGAHVRFGNLDFVITTEGELVWSFAATQPLLFGGLEAIIKASEELQLPTTKVYSPRNNQLVSLDYGRSCTAILVHEHLELHHDACDTLNAHRHEAPLEQPDRYVPIHRAKHATIQIFSSVATRNTDSWHAR